MSKRKRPQVAETRAEYQIGTSNCDQTASAVYFLELTVENVRCFGPKQTLDLRDHRGHPARWTVILGDNGVGKTTLLRCLAGFETRTARAGFEHYLLLDTDVHISLERSVDTVTTVEAILCQGFGTETPSEGQRLISLFTKAKGPGYQCSPIRCDSEWCENSPEAGAIVCYGYGANRRLGGSALSDYISSSSTCSSLFDVGSSLINAEEWLLLADYAAVSGEAEVTNEQREQVFDLLIGLLPDVYEISVAWSKGATPRPSVLFDTPYGRVTLDQLGLGYKTLIAWMVDLAWRLFERYPNSPNSLAEPAIVLVDEIDLHLHPKWQRSIMSFLTERFPNAQFIVTAHSPLVVQASEGANLVLLRKEGDHVVIDNDVESIAGWRADQILTSELFGLDSARPPGYEQTESRRRELLAKSRLTKKEREELQRLEKEVAAWPTAERPEDIEAMRIIREAAQHLRKQGNNEG